MKCTGGHKSSIRNFSLFECGMAFSQVGGKQSSRRTHDSIDFPSQLHHAQNHHLSTAPITPTQPVPTKPASLYQHTAGVGVHPHSVVLRKWRRGSKAGLAVDRRYWIDRREAIETSGQMSNQLTEHDQVCSACANSHFFFVV